MKHLCVHVEMSCRNVFLHLQFCTYSTLKLQYTLKCPNYLFHMLKSQRFLFFAHFIYKISENIYIYILIQQFNFYKALITSSQFFFDSVHIVDLYTHCVLRQSILKSRYLNQLSMFGHFSKIRVPPFLFKNNSQS